MKLTPEQWKNILNEEVLTKNKDNLSEMMKVMDIISEIKNNDNPYEYYHFKALAEQVDMEIPTK